MPSGLSPAPLHAQADFGWFWLIPAAAGPENALNEHPDRQAMLPPAFALC
jgi:hypothetical protein